jgi:hypothetical protein
LFIPPSWFFQSLLPAGLVLLAAAVPTTAPAQDYSEDGILARSFSGQFIVTGSSVKSPLLSLRAVATNASFVRLDPALLAVSAERIKQSLYQLLAVPSARDWRGQICLVLRPALRTDETVTVVARPVGRRWSYLVQLPDVVQEPRFLRGMTGAVLLEMANRQDDGSGRSPEIPVWFIDGLCRQMLRNELAEVVLSAPDQPFDNPPSPRMISREHELDPLAEVRRVLRNHPALTFDQLSWPAETQLAGQDEGVYDASAQLFMVELLKLPDGPARLRRMLASLPACFNWQTAFQDAFRDLFPHPLDAEKWWALQVVAFLAHDPGPAWTPAYSAARLDELLAVPVEIRMSSNSLPGHVTIPLQTAIDQMDRAQQTAVLQTRLRDLQIAQRHMVPKFRALAEDYCRVLADYLGERTGPAPRQTSIKHPARPAVRSQVGGTVKKLDALDARRHALEAVTPAGNLPSY